MSTGHFISLLITKFLSKKKKRENTIWVLIDEVNIEWGWHQIFSFCLFDWTLDFSERDWIFPLHISYPKTNWFSSLSIIQYFKSSLFSAGSYHFQFLVSVSGSRPSKNCRVAEWHIYRKTQSSITCPIHSSPFTNKDIPRPCVFFFFFQSFWLNQNSIRQQVGRI